MKYERARSRIKSGHLLAWSHRGWGSWYDLQIQMVRMATRSEYCHVGIACHMKGRLWVIEAVRPVVRIFPLSLLLPFYHVPVPVQWNDVIEDWLIHRIGKPYSRWQAVLAGVDRLRAEADDEWQCAELYQAFSWRAGVALPGAATPTNLVNEAAKYRGCFPVE